MVDRFLDNLILLILILIMVFFTSGAVMPVIVFLVGMITAALGLYFRLRWQNGILCAVFIAACFFLPDLTYFIPMVLGMLYRYRFYWGVAAAVPSYLALSGYENWKIALWCGICFLSILLTDRTNRIEQLKTDMIRMRDSSTEQNMLLNEKNKDLMEKQDYEIYLATLRERNRIAREIHDNVGHMISRSILQVGALKTIHKEEPLNAQLSSINETLNLAMNNIRESVHNLHDDSIDLRQAVMDATKEMCELYQIYIDYDMSKTVPRNVKYCFIAIVKEAMSNIVKHSNADTIRIILREHPAFYQLFIEDNGTGKMTVMGDGIGLSNMRERTEALNGTIRIFAEDGFKLFITVKKEEI